MAARLAVNLEDVRTCLLMSRDGLTLGVFPKDEEDLARSVWDRLRSIGDPERGFLVVGEQLWILTRRGPYVGIVVAGSSATPGLLLDRLESTLRSAEELRVREGSSSPQPRAEAPRRPRTPLHPDPETAKPEREPEPVAAQARTVDISEPTTAEEAVSDPIKAALRFASMQGGRPISQAPDSPQALAPAPPAAPPQAPVQPAPPASVEPAPPASVEPAPPAPVQSAPPAPVPAVSEPPAIETPPPGPQHDPGDMPMFEPVAAKPRPPAAPPAPPKPVARPAPEPEAKPEPEPEPEPAPKKRDDSEVDPVALAREFSQLMKDD